MNGSVPRRGKIVFLIAFLTGLPGAAGIAEAADVRATLGFSKVLDLRAGIELDISDRWGVKADFGYSFLSNPEEMLYFSYDLVGFFTFTRPDRVFICRGLFGIIDGAIITLSPAVVAFAPGVSAFAGFRIGNRFDIGLRGGIGVLIQYENDAFSRDFPWPDLALEFHIHL